MTAAIGIATLGLAVSSITSVCVRTHREIPYPGIAAMSAPWSPMPEDETADWLVSRHVPPPPEDASREQLLSWLEEHYPVLYITLSEQQLEPRRRHIDIGGWPRHLTIEPGVGLIMRGK